MLYVVSIIRLSSRVKLNKREIQNEILYKELRGTKNR